MALSAAIAAFLITASGFRTERTGWSRVVDFARVLSTIVHEFGHALISFLADRPVKAISINDQDTGATVSSGGSWLSQVIAASAGYAAPPLAGLGVAVLLSDGKARSALIVTIVVVVLVLMVSHDLRTIAYVATVGLVVFAVVYWGSSGLQLWMAYTEAWLLLLCEIVGLRSFRVSDGRFLFRKTLIPGPVWVLGWLALNGWALWNAVPLLWP